ncbi:MAG: UDP-N-acetylmuramoyl-tripeptide--D-alanyl-D-alanine ligase [Rhodothermales bacterium]|nr:UDP-N-acetylmuramoyl-tripeptide--D-alanyl-D-alanine ligase [Rhodothermales bacterium]
MMLILSLGTVALLFAGWRLWRRLRFSLHVFQLHGYKIGEYARWLIKRPFNYVFRLSHVLGAGVLLLSYPLAGAVSDRALAAAMLGLWCVVFASSRRYRSEREKKPLVWTNRLKRLGLLTAVIVTVPIVASVLVVLLLRILDLPHALIPDTRLVLRALLLGDLIAPLAVIGAAILLEPVEAFFRSGFKRKARHVLETHPDLKVIAITGSYGKTSVKFIIAEILRQRYQVLATPGSYNTPMGICKVINNDLQPNHQVLVVEMGARYPGDIAELCDLVEPQLAVITNVGVAHLESMGSIEAIAHEKGTLARRVVSGGTVVLNADDPHVLAMAQETAAHVTTISTEGNPAELSASDIHYGPHGASFVVRDDHGAEQAFTTRLLGKHNVANILMGIAVGQSMGLRLRQIAHAVRRVEPVEHRLHLRSEGQVLVIDDAFNSNPVGAINAVEILGQFRTGRRIIVTPGMIELGMREEEENRSFGQAIAGNADLAILVGHERTRPIVGGLLAAEFPEQQIRVVSTLFEARDFLKGYLQAGDVVLYENDLPDQYDEPA